MAKMARADVVEFLKNRDKTKPREYSCNYLGDNDLSGLDLSGFDLSHLDLQWIDFTGADLSGANMDGSFLCGTKFIQTNLSGASMKDVTITMTDFTDCQMQRVVLSGANWLGEVGGAYFHRCDMNGSKFEGAKLNALFTFCNLTDATFDNATITGSSFLACNLSFASFRNVDLREIHLNFFYMMGSHSVLEFPKWVEYGEVEGYRFCAIPKLDHIDLTGARQSSETLRFIYTG